MGTRKIDFFCKINLSSALEIGTVDGPTLDWWSRQGDAARSCAFGGGLTSDTALQELRTFCYARGLSFRVWGNSAAFDLGLLGCAYKALGELTPWSHKQEACYRTLKNLRKDVPAPAFAGVQHHALDDARHQLRHLLALLEAIRPESVADGP